MLRDKNTCKVTTSLLLTPLFSTLLEGFEKSGLKKWKEEKRKEGKERAGHAYFLPKVYTLSRRREGSLKVVQILIMEIVIPIIKIRFKLRVTKGFLLSEHDYKTHGSPLDFILHRQKIKSCFLIIPLESYS